jgi:glycine/D-amino acid oxidase-like deaminating enzyme
MIFDECIENTSSNKAAGLYNPITGRNMVKSWLADDLFPDLPSYYSRLENELDARFHKEIPIYRPFHNAAELNDWMGKVNEKIYRPFVSGVESSTIELKGLMDSYVGLSIKNSGFVNLPQMLQAFRIYFSSIGAFQKEVVLPQEMKLEDGICYNNIKANKMIFCEGPKAVENSWWGDLPFRLIRGEMMDIKCALPTDKVYNRGVFALPRDGFFRIGSTYDHENMSYVPEKKGIEELERRFKKLYSEPYEIISISAGVRPTTNDRRPYIGWHPENKGIGIFNGFGTKGVSLVPYFSKLFVDSIEGKAKVHTEADVRRVF